tara:strand:- start:177 stop:584 length:408 start_codon:yes stop_codon:yes gene_type:complete
MLYKLIEDLPVEYTFDKKERIILCGVPGPFTPGCSSKHLPGFANNLQELKDKGITKVVFIAVSNAYVMNAWNEKFGHDEIDCIGDPYGEYIEEISQTMWNPMLARASNRFAVLIEDGKITKQFKDPFVEGVLNDL